jgi:nucleoid DNA-binding protein/DNA-directed RNA polymerase subunit RPC12/RpoP
MGVLYSKNNLIVELSRTASISRRRTEALLEALTQIAYREAPKGFTVPGICRLDVVHRQARRARNPATGETLLIAEHDALRVRPLRKAKQAVAPAPANLVQVQPDGAPAPAATAAAANRAPAPAAAAPAAAEKFISFRCQNCSQEIEAPLDMAGSSSECPSCGNTIEIPFTSGPGTLWGGALPEQQVQAQTPAQQEAVHEAMKSRTIRIELPDDF